ncbi:MAG TPA: FmdB family zinc ribbon protein [Nitrospira sp.]|nr:FmdB family zinc ribbon protein [Nitrospira sp.]
MPIYEYLCLDCRKRSSLLILSLSNPAPAACTHCRSGHVERLLSRFASPKSEEARLESLADPGHLDGLDENDPQSVARFMKQMGDEMGEEVGADVEAMMESGEEETGSDDSGDSL